MISGNAILFQVLWMKACVVSFIFSEVMLKLVDPAKMASQLESGKSTKKSLHGAKTWQETVTGVLSSC